MNELTPQPENKKHKRVPTATNPQGAGRPLFDGRNIEDIISKLKYVWSIGGTDEEACHFAEVDDSTLYRFLKRRPDILSLKHKLKAQPVLKARNEVVKGLDGNPEFSLKFLERKRPDEFMPKGIVDANGVNGSLHLSIVNLIRNNNACKPTETDAE